MTATTKMTALTLAAALAGAATMATTTMLPANAADPVRCYGIAKAGENDCENAAGTHSCAGQSTVDYDGGEWKLIVEGAEKCVEMGGATDPFEGVGPLNS